MLHANAFSCPAHRIIVSETKLLLKCLKGISDRDIIVLLFDMASSASCRFLYCRACHHSRLHCFVPP